MVRTRPVVSSILLGGLLFTTSLLGGQDEQTTFKSDTDLVVLHVNVFDRSDDAVPNLPREAFRVYEEDAPQDITIFSGADVPVAAGLILDGSSSMISREQTVFVGGAAFARSSHPEDELFTIHFNEAVTFGLPPTVKFTGNQLLLRSGLMRYRAGGKTALYDAVIAGLDHLELSSNQKRVLVVLSDGKDNASLHSEHEMLDRVRASNAIVYTVSNARRGDGTESDPNILRKLGQVSGGAAYFPDSDKEVIQSFDDIGSNVRRGYMIGYVSANNAHDEAFRHVKVTVTVPGRARVSVRSRDGYYAHHHADAR